MSGAAEGGYVPVLTAWIKRAAGNVADDNTDPNLSGAEVVPGDLEIALSCLDRGNYDAALARAEGGQSDDESEGAALRCQTCSLCRHACLGYRPCRERDRILRNSMTFSRRRHHWYQ